MSANSIAFVGHSFHKKTQSSNFFVELLKKRYRVETFWDDSWQGGPPVDLLKIKNRFDRYVFWQSLYRPRVLQRLDPRRVTLVPMWDGVSHFSDRKWRSYRNFKIISFSLQLSRRLQSLGLSCLQTQYYPKPNFSASETSTTDNSPSKSGKPTIYFWQRVNEINWSVVRQLIRPDQVEKVIINKSVDPEHEFQQPSVEDCRDYQIETIGWIEDFQKYCKILEQVDLYIAPRPLEGIGLSFLDAMARGIPVIAADQPTANEYVHQENGYLYDLQNPEPIELGDVRSRSARVKIDCETGYINWRSDIDLIFSYIENQLQPSRRKFLTKFFQRRAA